MSYYGQRSHSNSPSHLTGRAAPRYPSSGGYRYAQPQRHSQGYYNTTQLHYPKYLSNLHPMNRISGLCKITEGLYISSYEGAMDDVAVRTHGITCVVNATPNLPNPTGARNIEYLRVPVDDIPTAQLSPHFEYVAAKINEVKNRGGKTLVHCVAGVSRSCTLCIAYLMKYQGLSLLSSHQLVRTARPIVRPNNGFWRQLIEYEKKLRGGVNTVNMVHSTFGEIPDIYAQQYGFKRNMRNYNTRRSLQDTTLSHWF